MDLNVFNEFIDDKISYELRFFYLSHITAHIRLPPRKTRTAKSTKRIIRSERITVTVW